MTFLSIQDTICILIVIVHITESLEICSNSNLFVFCFFASMIQNIFRKCLYLRTFGSILTNDTNTLIEALNIVISLVSNFHSPAGRLPTWTITPYRVNSTLGHFSTRTTPLRATPHQGR